MHDGETFSCELGKLKDLDNLLKCAICYEYLKTSLITPCSHNFCSYCIRQSLSYRNQCPSCFEDISESQLRNNRIVDEFISIFTCVKEKLFKYVSYLPNPKVADENLKKNSVLSEKKNTKELSAENTFEPFTLKSNVEDVGHCDTPHDIPPSTSKDEVGKSSSFSPRKEVQIPSMFSPKQSKSLSSNEVRVPCPVCTVEIPEKSINVHLDACLKRTEEKRVKIERQKLLPKLVYHLLSDKDLRKKLQELGLSNVGDRATLINRHKRYTLLYNSECDSLTPKSVSEILIQLKKEEEEEKKSVLQVVKKLNVDRKADPQVNEEAQRQYLKENKSVFEKLTEEARRNRESRKNNTTTVVTFDETSNSSDNEVRMKCPGHKRKFITSDSEDEIKVIGTLDRSLLEQQTGTIHSKVVANKKNEVVESKTNVSGFHIESNMLTVYDDSTDVGTDDDFVDDANQEMATRNERKKKSSSVNALQSSTFSNSVASVTSPVLGVQSRLSRTPRSASKHTNSFRRDLAPDFRPLEASVSSSPRGVPAGQESLKDEVDSDSSSTHSTSLMVYTGPDCENEFEQSSPIKIPSSVNPNHTTIPEGGHCNFDLGIEEVLKNSEEFISIPVHKPARTRRKKQRNTSEPETKGRVLRKRVKIDDL